MSLEHWLAFAAASGLLLAMPGPAILLVISYAVGQGRRTALPTITGVALGDLTAMTLAMVLMGILHLLWPGAFATAQWLGALYVLFLIVKLWRKSSLPGPLADNDNLPEEKPIRILGHAFAVTALNPRNLLFFIAFMPLFVDPRKTYWSQAVVLEGTFLLLAVCNCIAYACLAARARAFIRRKAIQRSSSRPKRPLLISAGSVTAGYRRIAA